MTVRCVLSEQAQIDVQDTWWHVFQHQACDARADAALEKLFRSMSLLVEQPSMGRPREWGPGQLVFPAGNYLIVFRIVDETVRVSRVGAADADLRDNPG